MPQPAVVAPWRTTYAPGDWYLIAGPTSLVLLEPGAGRADMVADLWSDVVASSSMSDLIDRLAGYGITELPDLAVVFWSQAGMRTLVRGGIQLFDPDSARRVADGMGIVTWNEVDLEHVTKVRLELRGQRPDGDLLPMSVGVVRVGAVSISSDEDAVVRSPQALLRTAGRIAVAPVAIAAAGETGRADEVASAGAGEAQAQLPEETDQGDDQPDTADLAAQSAAQSAAEAVADDDTGPDFPPIETEPDEQVQTDESQVAGFDSPWGPQLGMVGGAGAGAVGAAGAASPPFSIEQFEMENDDTQLMDNPVILPGQSSGQGSPEPPDAAADVADRKAADDAAGPLVEAIRCPNGHANAPGSGVCRVCRAPIPPSAPQLIPEPLLARLRTADGALVDLDRAVLLGRAPSEQRSTVPLPRLVTLASPAQDISRTHLQVVPENWQVVVTDLRSTNGTFVTDPGPNGNRGLLPPGQPVPVPIGATLELGEGVTITVEAPD